MTTFVLDVSALSMIWLNSKRKSVMSRVENEINKKDKWLPLVGWCQKQHIVLSDWQMVVRELSINILFEYSNQVMENDNREKKTGFGNSVINNLLFCFENWKVLQKYYVIINQTFKNDFSDPKFFVDWDFDENDVKILPLSRISNKK